MVQPGPGFGRRLQLRRELPGLFRVRALTDRGCFCGLFPELIDSVETDGDKMKEKMRIHGGARLEGEVMVSGGKNAAVAIIPAALLGDSPSVIENVPDINDVHIIIEMLKYLGAQDRKSTRLNSSHPTTSRMPSSA